MKNELRIGIIDGDGIGPELAQAAEQVLDELNRKYMLNLSFLKIPACGAAIEQYQSPLPASSLEAARSCQAILIGNVGSGRYRALPPSERPEAALLRLRSELHVCTNLRPVRIEPQLVSLSPLKEEFLAEGLHILVVRDLQGGMYSETHPRKVSGSGRAASDLEYYDEDMIRASASIAFRSAQTRRRMVCSLDKSNVLSSSILWRKTVSDYAGAFPDVSLTHQYIDNAAMEVILHPGKFDVILTSNVFGDILSDELACLSGAPCLLGSAELAADGRGIYTPNQLHHPDLLPGTHGYVHPLGILSAAAMMLRYSCRKEEAALCLEQALRRVLARKLTTAELPVPGFSPLTTAEFCREVIRCL